jgi:hypothetical protein
VVQALKGEPVELEGQAEAEPEGIIQVLEVQVQ